MNLNTLTVASFAIFLISGCSSPSEPTPSEQEICGGCITPTTKAKCSTAYYDCVQSQSCKAEELKKVTLNTEGCANAELRSKVGL